MILALLIPVAFRNEVRPTRKKIVRELRVRELNEEETDTSEELTGDVIREEGERMTDARYASSLRYIDNTCISIAIDNALITPLTFSGAKKSRPRPVRAARASVATWRNHASFTAADASPERFIAGYSRNNVRSMVTRRNCDTLICAFCDV